MTKLTNCRHADRLERLRRNASLERELLAKNIGRLSHYLYPKGLFKNILLNSSANRLLHCLIWKKSSALARLFIRRRRFLTRKQGRRKYTRVFNTLLAAALAWKFLK